MRIFIFLLLPFLVVAQDEPSYDAQRIPLNLLENADAVVRTQEITFTVSSSDDAVLKEKRVVTLLNDKSSYGELILHYNNFNKIGKIKASLYDAAGNFLRDIEKKEIEDFSAISSFSIYEDSRVRYLNVNHDRYPYTVGFEYEIKFRDLLGYPDWDIQQFNTAVEKARFVVSLPEQMKLYRKSLNIKLDPTITTDNGWHRYEWKVENLPAVKKEPYAPSFYDLIPQVLVSPEVFKADGYTGSMASWKAFGQFQFDLAKDRDVLSPGLKAKVRELTAGATTEGEKIAVLYRYLQENTRYVSVQLGIGGWQPFDAQYVEKNKYGDCKALSNFMKALLKEAGIVSNTVLVKAGDSFLDLPDDFATNAFNHMILYVPSQDTWLECTSSSFPPNYLGDFTGDRKVLLITEQGGKLARTPAPAGNTAVSHTDIALTAEGKAVIAVQSTLNGSLHEWYRYVSEDLPPDEMKKKIQEKSPLPQAYFSQISIEPQKTTPSVHFNYKMEVPQYGSKAGKRLFLPANPVNAFRDVPPANDKRMHPVEVKDGYTELDTVILHLPEGYSVESIPAENTALTTEFGSYSSQVVRRETDGALQVVRRLEIKPVRLPAGRYGEWRNFCRDIAKADGMKVVLIQKT